MKQTALTAQAALDRAKNMPYAYIRMLSSVYVGATPECIMLQEILEARFFSEASEIQFLRNGAELTALEVADEDGDITVDQRSELMYPAGSFLTKRRYILPDEDGQCSIVATRLLRWDGA